MGCGYEYKCNNCGIEYSAYYGKGFDSSAEYVQLIVDIVEGKYGEDLKQEISRNVHVAINSSQEIYVCSNCGNWKQDMSLTTYEPINVLEMDNDPWWQELFNKLGCYPYLPAWYRVKKRRYIYCEKCHRRMRKATFESRPMLSCPKCGKLNAVCCEFFWD